MTSTTSNRSITEIKAANEAFGHYFFEPATLRFFNSKIGRSTYAAPDGGEYFITSEQFDYAAPRLYTIRHAHPNGSVDTVGAFQAYETSADARAAIRRLQDES